MQKKKRILIADDDAHMRRILSLWLTRHGYEVDMTCDGRSALERFRAAPPDLLLSDVNMPGMNGIELLREVEATEIHIRGAILLTNRCDQIELKELVAGPNVYVMPKPFSPRKLLELVDQILTSQEVEPPVPTTMGLESR
jgi:two-component system OmpR family response regulator